MNNVVDICETGKPHVANYAGALEDLLWEYIENHRGKVTVAEACGALEIVKHKLLKGLLDE